MVLLLSFVDIFKFAETLSEDLARSILGCSVIHRELWLEFIWLNLTSFEFTRFKQQTTCRNIYIYIIYIYIYYTYIPITHQAGCPFFSAFWTCSPRNFGKMQTFDSCFSWWNFQPTTNNQQTASISVRPTVQRRQGLLKLPGIGPKMVPGTDGMWDRGTWWRYWGVFFLQVKTRWTKKNNSKGWVGDKREDLIFVWFVVFCVWPIDIPCDDAVFWDLP